MSVPQSQIFCRKDGGEYVGNSIRNYPSTNSIQFYVDGQHDQNNQNVRYPLHLNNQQKLYISLDNSYTTHVEPSQQRWQSRTHLEPPQTLHSTNYPSTPRLFNLLKETRYNFNLSNSEYLSIVSILNRNMIRSSKDLLECSEVELSQLGIPFMFVKNLKNSLKKYHLPLHQIYNDTNSQSNTLPDYSLIQEVSSSLHPNQQQNACSSQLECNVEELYLSDNQCDISRPFPSNMVNDSNRDYNQVDLLNPSTNFQTVHFKCQLEQGTSWPVVAKWCNNEGEMFQIVIGKSFKNNDVRNISGSIESNDFLDFRNKFIRISVTPSSIQKEVILERVENEDLWGFMTTDASVGQDFISHLRYLGFPYNAIALFYGTERILLGFEKLPLDQEGSIVIKREENLLLMRFPKYGSEQVKGTRKRKVVLIKFRFKFEGNIFYFYTLFNLRKEKSNTAISRDDVWISNLFLDEDSCQQEKFSKIVTNESEIVDTNIETPSSTLSSISSQRNGTYQNTLKRVCKWQTLDSENLQFRNNFPKLGRGGTEVICTLDYFPFHEDDSLKPEVVSNLSIESEILLVEADQSYDFIEKGFFKITNVFQYEDHIDIVVRMPRPVKETKSPQTIYFQILYNMKSILNNPIKDSQGCFTYDVIDKEELCEQFKEKMIEFYHFYSSQFEDEIKKAAAVKLVKEFNNYTYTGVDIL